MSLKSIIGLELSKMRIAVPGLLGAFLLSVPAVCRADYQGTLVSAVADTPIEPGTDLSVQLTVQNTGSSAWEGDFLTYPSWKLVMESPSWTTPFFPAESKVFPTVGAASTFSLELVLPSLVLPSAAGEYSIRIQAFRPQSAAHDNNFVPMNGSPQTVTFRISGTPSPTPRAAKGDLDGDGRPDVVFQDAEGYLAVWSLQGAEMKSAAFLNPKNVGDLRYRIVASADFDGDGKNDLLFQSVDGTLAVWFMDGLNLRSPALLSPSNPGQDWRVVGTGDFNGDKKTDLVFQHRDGTLALWYMDGVKLSSAEALQPNHPGDLRWRVASVADFNQDGQDDLLFQHTDGTLAVWTMKGRELLQPSLVTPKNPGEQWRVVGSADRNGDGKPDLLFQHAGDGTLAVWFMNGLVLADVSPLKPFQAGGSWKVVAP